MKNSRRPRGIREPLCQTLHGFSWKMAVTRRILNLLYAFATCLAFLYLPAYSSILIFYPLISPFPPSLSLFFSFSRRTHFQRCTFLKLHSRTRVATLLVIVPFFFFLSPTLVAPRGFALRVNFYAFPLPPLLLSRRQHQPPTSYARAYAHLRTRAMRNRRRNSHPAIMQTIR